MGARGFQKLGSRVPKWGPEVCRKKGPGCHPILLVWQFHDGIDARVPNVAEHSEPFVMANGVKQSCINALTLFGMMFSATRRDAFRPGL